jgi:peptidoglycan-associated lipoprotein
MMAHRITFAMLTVALVMVGCGSEPPPQEPTPEPPPRVTTQGPDTMAQRLAEEATLAAELARLEAEREAAAVQARTAITQRINFDYDKSELTPAAREILRQKLDPLRCNGAVMLRIEGHADERGSTEYNVVLGNNRAQEAKNFLVSFGVPDSRLTTISFGEERPLMNAATEQAYAANRRDEFIITAGGDNLGPCG